MLKRPWILAVLISLAQLSPAGAEPLAAMAGKWTGSGWAKEDAATPAETVRCRLDNTYDASKDEISVAGICAAPGRRVTVEGVLNRRADGALRGVWMNPNGVGQARVKGQVSEDTISFVVNRNNQRRIVFWQIAGDRLKLSTYDGNDQTTMLAEINFAR